MATTDTTADGTRTVLTVPAPCPGLRVSPEAFWEICAANPDLRLTRTSGGEVLVISPAGSESSGWNVDLVFQLETWNRANRLGRVFESSAGFTLPNGFVHAPDVAWVARERWEALPREARRKFAPVCPDFVVELMSPSDRRGETRQKLEEFLAQGARLGWLIDPDAGEVEVYRPARPPEVLKRPETLSGEDVLPGFVLDLQAILFE